MVVFPAGLRLSALTKAHRREGFESGQPEVDRWLRTRALQSQEKRLSVTRVLTDDADTVVGFFSLATGQVDLGELPAAIAKKLPKRLVPVAVLAWLGVDRSWAGRGLGTRLFAQALADCHAAGRTFPFVAVLIDCIDTSARKFYGQWELDEVPGRPMRLLLSARQLEALMAG